MRVFVAGASGAIGRPLARQLVAAGHEVTGMTRREEQAAELRGAGAEAVVCDVYDAEGLREAEEVRKRRYPIVGEGDATFSFIHVDDAARAVVAALDHGAPGIYNVTDDEPAPMREWLPAFAELLGAKPPRRLPPWLVRAAVGKAVARSAVGTRGASNEKAKRELGWQPAHPSWRQGFPELFAA